MDEIIHAIIDHFKQEWAMVTHAPFLFLFSVLIVGAIIAYLTRLYFEERIRTLETTVDHKQGLVDEYKDRLQDKTPVEVAAELASLKAQVTAISTKVIKPQRKITPAQKKVLLEGLPRAEGLPMALLHISTCPDTESTRYARSMCAALSDTNVNAQMNTQGIHDEGERGLTIYRPDDETKRIATFMKIVEVFRFAGVPFTEAQDTRDPNMHYFHIAPDED